MFAYPDQILMLDFEVAHYGDPAFDTAFCLNHLILPAIAFPARATRYLETALAFWHSYREQIAASLAHRLEATTIRELGCLLLARIDGKSKIPYITDLPKQEQARSIARAILIGDETSLDQLLTTIQHRIMSLDALSD
jgi:5-methylthioribose kinase